MDCNKLPLVEFTVNLPKYRAHRKADKGYIENTLLSFISGIVT